MPDDQHKSALDAISVAQKMVRQIGILLLEVIGIRAPLIAHSHRAAPLAN
jgi:hypothetical protein